MCVRLAKKELLFWSFMLKYDIYDTGAWFDEQNKIGSLLLIWFGWYYFGGYFSAKKNVFLRYQCPGLTFLDDANLDSASSSCPRGILNLIIGIYTLRVWRPSEFQIVVRQSSVGVRWFPPRCYRDGSFYGHCFALASWNEFLHVWFAGDGEECHCVKGTTAKGGGEDMSYR